MGKQKEREYMGLIGDELYKDIYAENTERAKYGVAKRFKELHKDELKEGVSLSDIAYWGHTHRFDDMKLSTQDIIKMVNMRVKDENLKSKMD